MSLTRLGRLTHFIHTRFGLWPLPPKTNPSKLGMRPRFFTPVHPMASRSNPKLGLRARSLFKPSHVGKTLIFIELFYTNHLLILR